MLRNKTQDAQRKTHSARRRIFKVLTLCFALCVVRYALAQEQFVYDSEGKRNPFIPLVTSDGRLLMLDKEESEVAGGLSLEGIIYDKNGRSFAIVSGSVVGVGDSIAGYQVLKVEETRVIFIKDGEPKEIRLKEEEP